MYKSVFPENHKVAVSDFKEELVGKSTSMILNADNADFRDNEEAEKAREKEMAKDKAESKVPGMPHKEGFKRYQPLSEELIDDSKSTVKDALGGDFTMQDKDKKKKEDKKEESTMTYKPKFTEGRDEEDEDDVESPNTIVQSWINGNRGSVMKQIKEMKPSKIDDVANALAKHFVSSKDVAGIKRFILAVNDK